MLKIVLTGGPCSGKTQMSNVFRTLENIGYHIFTVSEAATSLILNGIKPSENVSMDDFQEFIIDTQLANERIYEEVTKYYDPSKIIIIYDRGIMDGSAYVSKASFENLLKRKGLTVSDVLARFDAVFHLVTAADGAEEFYSWNDPNKEDVGNNAARRENPEEARISDKKTLNAWIGHPNLKIFDNSTDFEGKKARVMNEILSLLESQNPKEVERKYLIKKPSDIDISKLGCVSETNIVQTYLRSKPSLERRVRQRGTIKDGFVFYYTEKRDVSPGVRIEHEKQISKDEYLSLLSEADTSLHQISKKRYCFIYQNQYFEMDVYPFSDQYAIVEIELRDINDIIDLPPLDFVKDVTGDKRYCNFELAKNFSLAL